MTMRFASVRGWMGAVAQFPAPLKAQAPQP